MKLLFLTHYDNMYGANRALYQLMKGLKEQKAEVILVIPAEGEMTEAVSRLGIPYFLCGMTQWQAVFKEPVRFWIKKCMRRRKIGQELDALTERFQGEGIDAIHSNSSVIGTGAMLAERLGCKHIWHIREFSKEHFRMKYFYSKKLVRHYYEKADCVVAISDALAESYRRKYPDAKVVRIYDGVSLEGADGGIGTDRLEEWKDKDSEVFFAAAGEDENLTQAHEGLGVKENGADKAEAGMQGQKKTSSAKNDVLKRTELSPVKFACVGYLFPMKHQMDIIEACGELDRQKFTKYEVYFIGGGKPEYEEQLKKRSEQLGLSGVKFLGYRSDVQELLETMDVGMIASEYEGFGLVTVEYMLHGLPVIGRDSGGTPEIVRDGETGCLYQDMPGLVKAMKYMMEQEERRLQMGRNGRRRALEHFTQQQNTQAMLRLYEMLLEPLE